MKKQAVHNTSNPCRAQILGIKSAMEILSGKWKLYILGTLLLHDKMRFMDLLREIDGIAAKMLSKELQDMEINQLVRRTVVDTKPLTVQYELTSAGRSLQQVITEVSKWGIEYRDNL